MRIGGEAPKGGPILQQRHHGHGWVRDTATSDRHRQCRVSSRTRAEPVFSCPVHSDRRVQAHIRRHLAGGRQAPQRDQQLAGERHNHRLPGGAAAILGALPEPPGQRTVRLMPQKAPGELDQRPPHAGVAGLGEPLLAWLAAALVGRTGEAGVTGTAR